MAMEAVPFHNCCGTVITAPFPYPLPREYLDVTFWQQHHGYQLKTAIAEVEKRKATEEKAFRELPEELKKVEKNVHRMGIIVGTINETQYPMIWPILEEMGWCISEKSKNYNSGKYIYLVYKLLHKDG